MADLKISQLTNATTPLAGTEVLPIVQSSTTTKVTVANVTAGRDVAAKSFAASSATTDFTNIDLTNTSTGGVSYRMASGGQFGYFDIPTGAFAIRDLTNSATRAYWTTAGNQVLPNGNLVIGTNGKGIVTNTAGQITQDAFSGFTSGVAKVISPAKSSGFMVYVTGYSLSGGYSAILNYGDTILVVSELNTTGGVVAFTSVSNQLNVTTTGTASQIFQELWVSVIGK